MPLPHGSASLPQGNVPASYLDDNFNAITAATGASSIGYTTPGALVTTVGAVLGQWLGTASNPIAIPTTPVGNALATNSVFAINATTAAATTREMAAQIGMVATTGSTQNNLGTGDKVSLYLGMIGQAGGGNIWAFNPLVTIAAGWTGVTGGGNATAQVAEFDLNNNNADYGPSSGGAFGTPSATGLVITGAGTNYCTAGIQIVGNRPGSNPMWRFGLWCGNNSIQNTTFWDNTNSVNSIVINGSHTNGIVLSGGTFSSYGIDLNNATVSSAVRLGNNQVMVARNAAGTGDLALIQLSNGNNLYLGGAGVGGIFAFTGLLPFTTNSFVLGQSSNAWSAVWTQQLQITADRNLIFTNSTNGGAAGAGTLGNAPTAGNPGFWLKTSINGTNYQIPCWAG